MLILMTANRLAPKAVQVIADAGHELLLLNSDDPAGELTQILATRPVDAVISRTLPITAAHIASCPTLGIISRHGVGYDIVDLDAATKAGIPVTIADAGNAQSVAELAIGLMFAAARQIPAMDQSIRSGKWNRSGAGLQLAGRRLGLVAYGAIGQGVARMARAIGMEVHVFDPHAPRTEDATWHDDLSSLLQQSDVLSLHVPLLPQTRGMIGAAELAMMPKDAIVINTARGGLVDEPALAAAIDSGHIAAAGIDTFAQEPLPPDHLFHNQPRIAMTPHIGGSTDMALDNVALSAVRNIFDTIEGGGPNPRLVVNPAVLSSAPQTS